MYPGNRSVLVSYLEVTYCTILVFSSVSRMIVTQDDTFVNSNHFLCSRDCVYRYLLYFRRLTGDVQSRFKVSFPSFTGSTKTTKKKKILVIQVS